MALLAENVVNVEIGPITDTPWWPPAEQAKSVDTQVDIQVDISAYYSTKKESFVPEIKEVESNLPWLNSSALQDYEVEKCSMVEINNPARLMDFNKACTGNGSKLWDSERPWMALPLGSYEQMRLIFEWENDPASVIQLANRIMEWRYSHSEMASLEYHSDEVHGYCDEDSESINAYLRSGVLDEDYPQRNESILDHIEKLDTFMAKSEGISQTIYRGMKLPIADYIKFRDSGSLLFKNFVSCSLAPIMFNYGIAECRHLDLSAPTVKIVERTAFNWKDEPEADRRHVKINFEITNDKTPFICPGEISEYPEECEVILDRNMVFVIEELLEYGSGSKYDWPAVYIKVKAIPLVKFNGTTLVL